MTSTKAPSSSSMIETESPIGTLSSISSLLHQLLTEYNLDAHDLTSLDASCSFFSRIAQGEETLSWTEAAALDLCKKKLLSFESMTASQIEYLKNRCGGSWKRVLRFLLAREFCSRWGKSQVLTGPGHSIAISSNGVVSSFGSNEAGQLGYATQGINSLPQQIRSLFGVRIVQAAVGFQRTLLVSDTGRVYASGVTSFGEVVPFDRDAVTSFVPQIVDTLRHIFVVDITIGHYFSAVLSREGKDGRVCTWGCGVHGCLGYGDEKYQTVPKVVESLAHLQVVYVSAGAFTTFVVTKDGDVYSLGYEYPSSVGLREDEVAVFNDDVNPSLLRLLIKVPYLKQILQERVVQISSTKSLMEVPHTLVLTESDKVYGFGAGNTCQLGVEMVVVPNNVAQRAEPKRVEINFG
ncbi:probable E3 ubiquitin-protein ligase HERC3 [Impatiens glandulifera]|uniref:probable E3 ubiquitin-protein ligase HERC3 n=1 Tax=Impatiens glandulifera TaxID=253017 RepID=UPI001FB0D6E6|nr:probable E3 ubiquitin-protein ligase HERC3 [Impatiens glandulifera]